VLPIPLPTLRLQHDPPWLWLNRRPVDALAWPAALVAAYAVELGSKLMIDQHRSGVWRLRLTLDSSFPSGHMLRAILSTGAVSALWPWLRRPLAWWCAAVAVCLLVSGGGGVPAGERLASAHRYRPRHLAGLALQRWAQAVANRRPAWWWRRAGQVNVTRGFESHPRR
jgi:hypothetical protein